MHDSELLTLKIIFILTNSVDPDEMLDYASESSLIAKVRIYESLVYKELTVYEGQKDFYQVTCKLYVHVGKVKFGNNKLVFLGGRGWLRFS